MRILSSTQTKEYSVDVEQTSHDNLFDALRLSSKRYHFAILLIQAIQKVHTYFLNLILVLKSFYTESEVQTLLSKYVYIFNFHYLFFLN